MSELYERSMFLLVHASRVSPVLRAAVADVEAEVARLRARVPDDGDLLAVCNVAEYAAKTFATDEPEELANLMAIVGRLRASVEKARGAT